MGDDAINLRDQVAVVRRRWRVVVLCAVGGLVLALGVSLIQSPLYRSSTRLELTPVNAAQTATNGLVMQSSEIATQVQVLLSTPVAERVIDRLNLDVTPATLLESMSVEQEQDTRVITVTALRPNATQAQEVAEAFAEEYLAFRKEQATEQNQQAVAALAEEAQRVRDRLAEIQRELDGAGGVTLTQLQSEQQALFVELTQILSDQASESVNSPGALGNGGQILVPAAAPGGPAEPQPVKAALLGAFLGLLLGTGLAFVRDHFDDALRDESRLREVLAPRPVLGRIPHWANARSGRLATVMDPASQVSEAYRALSTNIRFLLAVPNDPSQRRETTPVPRGRLAKVPKPTNGRTGKVMLVTSAREAEGKTSLASNLAVVAARFGLKVILVDADLRSPQLAGVFGLGRPPGLSDLLASDDSYEDYLIEVEDLKVLPVGSLVPNPAELLASPQMRELLATLAASADLVVVDGTPVTLVSDALELVAACDLVLLVARHGQTRLRSFEEAVDKIHQVGGNVSGAVYVDAPARTGGEAYGYGYTSDPGTREGAVMSPPSTPVEPTAQAAPPAAAASRPGVVKPGADKGDVDRRESSKVAGATTPSPGDKPRISKAAK